MVSTKKPKPIKQPEMFKCDCPFEVRSGCSEQKCPHYLKPREPDDGFGDYGVKIGGSQVISRTGSR